MPTPKSALLALAQAVLLAISSTPGLLAQQTVGNGTVMLPSAGEQEPYGINAANVGAQTDFTTRHFRRGNSTGIGSSFLQTTSPTSEGSPAIQVEQRTVTPTQIRLPQLESPYSSNLSSPALNIFTPALPHSPRSTALSAPSLGMERFGSTNTGLEDLPSFSRQPSFMDKMKF